MVVVPASTGPQRAPGGAPADDDWARIVRGAAEDRRLRTILGGLTPARDAGDDVSLTGDDETAALAHRAGAEIRALAARVLGRQARVIVNGREVAGAVAVEPDASASPAPAEHPAVLFATSFFGRPPGPGSGNAPASGGKGESEGG